MVGVDEFVRYAVVVVVDAGEECDDGNNADNDGCSANCTREGNEVPEFGTIAALGILGASAGIIYSRRRK